MAKSKALIASESEVAALQQQVAALQARLVLAANVYCNQKAQIAELESKLNGVQAPRQVKTEVTQFTRRDGSVWEKTRVGSSSRSRCVQPAPVQ